MMAAVNPKILVPLLTTAKIVNMAVKVNSKKDVVAEISAEAGSRPKKSSRTKAA